MTIHSNDGQSGLTKLERISQLAVRDKMTVFNNLGHIIDISLLKELYHRLDGTKAVGIDKVTKADYGERLEGNLAALLIRLRRGTYKPQPSRRVEIPKEDGSTRPLAIACIEDKLVQSAVSLILEKLFEPLFLPYSYGFRPEKNGHEALRALNKSTYQYWDGAVVEIDIRKYFNSIPHEELNKCLQKRIADKRFLQLVNTLMKSPIVEGKAVVPNEQGCPQGSIISPILSNIYLHYAIDEWFAAISQTHMRANAQEVRYADDMVFIFQYASDAKRFYKVLPKRLAKYGLKLHEDKSQLIKSGHQAAKRAHQQGKRLPTYKFLGFVCYWGQTRKGYWRLKFTSRSDRFTAKLKSLKQYLWNNLTTCDCEALLTTVVKVLRGWVNYHGISDNERRVFGFLEKSKRILFRWFNRRGRKRPMNWQKFNQLLERINFPKRWKTISMFQTG